MKLASKTLPRSRFLRKLRKRGSPRFLDYLMRRGTYLMTLSSLSLLPSSRSNAFTTIRSNTLSIQAGKAYFFLVYIRLYDTFKARHLVTRKKAYDVLNISFYAIIRSCRKQKPHITLQYP